MFFTVLLGSGLCAVPVRAQRSAADTVLSNGLRIGFDVGRLANYYLRNRKPFGLEATADVGYQRWIGVAELGYASLTEGRPNTYSYRSDGVYGRLGAERNLLKGGDDAVFWGLRYGVGRTGYCYGAYTVADSVWGNSTGTVPQATAWQHWAELVGGIKSLVFHNVYLGFTLRFRLKVHGSYAPETGPILIPGFGRASGNTAFGANYYIAYRIPFKKPATFVRKKKQRPAPR